MDKGTERAQRPCGVCRASLWLRRPGVGELVALRPALACLSSCSRKTSVVCAQCRHINTHEILAALPSCTRYACNEHANLCTFVTVRDRRACEHGRQRAPVQPGPGVLDLEAARNWWSTRRESSLPTGPSDSAQVGSCALATGAWFRSPHRSALAFLLADGARVRFSSSSMMQKQKSGPSSFQTRY